MYRVQFTLESNNKPITIYFSNTITVIPNGVGGSIIMDGNNNNGGWSVLESYEEVIKQIDSLLK